MDVYQFSTEFDITETHSNFVYAPDGSRKPAQIYRYDSTKFELRDVFNDTVLCALMLDDILELEQEKNKSNTRFQYVQPVYLKKKLHFFIATCTLDGPEIHLHLLDPSAKQALGWLYFTRKLQGSITNISISRELQIGSNQDQQYRIVTVGTLDSAMYVFRIASDFTVSALKEKGLPTRPIPCALIRTDAKNALSQEFIVLDNRDVYLVCGGFNGAIDFFLIKNSTDVSLEEEPELQYVRHQLIKLPTNLPIISIQHQMVSDCSSKQVLLIISQELTKMSRSSRALEPSVSIIRLDTQKLRGKDMTSTKFTIGTHLSPLIKKEDDLELYTCYLGPDKNKQLMISCCEFKTSEYKFQDRVNSFFLSDDERLKECHQVAILDQNTCWMLGKSAMFDLHTAVQQQKGQKRLLDI